MEKSSNKIQVIVAYASQTGNCESISDDFYTQLKEKYPKASRFTFNEHQKKKSFDLQEKDCIKLCILFTSSTGNGEFPENGENVHKFLRKHTIHMQEQDSSTMLSHVFYTILGLGDSNYSKYQGAPRYLDTTLLKLGAQKFYYRGEADEATSLELVVEPWLEGVISAIDKQIKQLKALPSDKVKELLTPVLIEEPEEEEEAAQKISKLDQITTTARVKSGRFLINNDKRQVIEIEIQTDKPISHEMIDVGSSLSLYPQNSESDVDQIIEQMQWDPKVLIGNKTVREMLINDIDIKSEKLKLQKFHSEYDLQFLPDELKNHPYLTFKDYAQHSGRIKDIPYSIIEDDLPKIKPRYFSILNDPYFDEENKHVEKSTKFKICFTVLRFPKYKQDQLEQGFCTTFLKDILQKQKFETTFRVHFSAVYRVIHLNKEDWLSKACPLIMLAHGTGIVPFISIIERLNNLKSQIGQHANLPGSVHLFFGGRNNNEEFFYRERIIEIFESLHKLGFTANIYLACSRQLTQQVNGESWIQIKKGYVQEYLKEPHIQKSIKDSMEQQNGHFMICGNKNTLGKAVIEGLTEGATKIFDREKFEEMKEAGKVLIELWNE